MPHKLARNDVRNGRFVERNHSSVRPQRELEHLRNAHAYYNGESYRRQYVHERFTPEQIARALRAMKGGITAASKVLGCARNTVLRYLDHYPELRETAQDEVELALDLAEHSLFVDAAGGDPAARKFLLLTRGRDRGYILHREVVAVNGVPMQGGDSPHRTLIVVGESKAEYLAKLNEAREMTRGGGQRASREGALVAGAEDGHGDAGTAPG